MASSPGTVTLCASSAVHAGKPDRRVGIQTPVLLLPRGMDTPLPHPTQGAPVHPTGWGAHRLVVLPVWGVKLATPAGNTCSTPHLGTHLHREMPVRLRLAAVTGEYVVEASGAHRFCQVRLNATFERVGAWCQTTPLEQSTDGSPPGEPLKQALPTPSSTGAQFPHLP